MSTHKYYLLYPLLLVLSADLLNAQHQSVYVPNNHQDFDYSNIEDLQALLQQPSNENVQINNEIDSSHSFTDQKRDFIPEISTETNSNTYSSETSAQSSDVITSVNKEHNRSDSTQVEHIQNQTNVPVEPSNVVAERLFQRRLMQSLMHLIPPNLWAQIQKNYTINNPTQPQYIKPILPNPVHLAESAAQAGLPAPGPYPIPDHLWHRNPAQIITRPPPPPRPTTTSTTTRTTTTTQRVKPSLLNNQHSLLSQIGFSCPPNSNGIRYPDRRLCNMYFTCSSTGLPEPNLCPEGYLFSDLTRDCELAAFVNCGSRLSAYFELEDAKMNPITITTTTTTTTTTTVTSRQKIHSSNESIECILGADGYYEDPLYCNVYHHCIAGIDYIEPCPNQLAWNDKKKMCDWSPNVNCTGKTMPLIQGKTSFCTNRQDGRYSSDTYCNVFHHCIGGVDHIVRCTGELQWDDIKKECGWSSSVRCGAPKKMLPNENKLNSTFCTGKSDGSYSHEEYCNVYHVCESGIDSMRQCPHQLYWDNEQKKCDWSNEVVCSKRTLVALAMESNLFCMEKSHGFYIDPHHCNVYHQCMADIDVKLRCPERLIFNETLQRCDWPETTTCKSGNVLVDEENNHGFCADKTNGNFAHEQYCNRYYICQNGKDVVFTCQNNLRYSIEKNECDWAVNVDCKGKEDYMWEGIKENFCKRLPDGNYPDKRYCNLFHQCQAAMDYPKRCPNRLMFNEETKECDWEDNVDCKGREKFIDTEGLDDAVRPGSNNTRGRSTKFCMVKENGDYADLYYCNVYHNCHGGFDTIQYCASGLVWRQESESVGRCDWPKERSDDGVDCTGKAVFFVEKLAENDILANLRSEFCISKGPGLYEHQRYCDLYLQCNEQGVGVTMECSPGLIFNEKKKECDFQAESNDESKGTLCVQPRSFLRSKPKAEQASVLFEGADATGQFPTHFDCLNKNQQNMFADADWCNIYHVCIGSRDNIFLCPPGTIFNQTKQGCMDRFDGANCNGTRSYYKPSINRQKREEFSSIMSKTLEDSQQTIKYRLPNQWKKPYQTKESNKNSLKLRNHRP